MTDRPCVVRRATVNDAAKLRTIRLEALKDTPEAYGSTYEQSLRWTPRHWRKVAKTRNYYLGECDGVVRGMASGGYNEERPGTWWLYSMYVSPSQRGTGLARQLVDEVVAWARGEGASELHLHVGSRSARARGFYTKLGFVERGDVIVMDRDPSIGLHTMVMSLD
jgi:GNAT superfamily N-acetyltransferase